MSLSNQISVKNKNYVVSPNNLNEAMHYAKLISDSTFCPKEFKGKQGDVLIAMQMGAEIGLSPMQALQNIAVINGKPCIYGDAALAVVISHPSYISHNEWFEGCIKDGDFTAYCSIIRKNSSEYIKSFSMEQAKKAGLWTKNIWQQYPERMLQMRARGLCIRDKFADALRGINLREEVEDYKLGLVEIDINKKQQKAGNTFIENEKLNYELSIDSKIDLDINQMMWLIENAKTSEDLQEVYRKFYKELAISRDNVNLRKLIDAKDKRKEELSRIETKIIDQQQDEQEENTNEEI